MTVADLAVYQKAYKRVSAEEEVAMAQMRAKETAYIKRQGIVNPDGRAPCLLCEIQDQTVFDKASKGFAKEMAASPLPEHLLACQQLKSVAEKKMLTFLMEQMSPLGRDAAQRIASQHLDGHKWLVEVAMAVRQDTYRETAQEDDFAR